MSQNIIIKSEPSRDTSLSLTPRTAFNNSSKKDKSVPKTMPKNSSTSGSKLGATKPKNHKSRTGCITCKKKRLKCDETHPYCNNCVNKGIVCGGYTTAFKWKSFDDKATPNHKSSKMTAVQMDSSVSLPIKREDSVSSTVLPERKMSRSLSSVDSDVLQRALEDATLSVTGKSYQEIAIANALIAAGKNPDLAAAVAKTLHHNKQGTDTESVISTNNANNEPIHIKSSPHEAVTPLVVDREEKKLDPLNSLATAAAMDQESYRNEASPPQLHSQLSPFSNTVPEFFFQKNPSNLPSPSNMDFGQSLMSPHFHEMLRGFENNGVSTPELMESFNHNLVKTRQDNHPSPAPSIGANNFNSPRFSSLMRSFTNFDPAVAIPSPANLEISVNDVNHHKRRFSEISSFSSLSQVVKRPSNNALYPGSMLESNHEDTDISTAYEPLSPTNSHDSGHRKMSIASVIPPQVELSDEKMKMLAGFDRYTCGLMSIREGNDNPWRTVMIPMAKEHSVLFNVFSAMTCFHIARGDEELRSQGIKYMRNTVIELARGLSDGSMQPEVALITCLCLQNSETWDRQTATGIAHLKGAKSMLIEILKNIQNGKKFLLDTDSNQQSSSYQEEEKNNAKTDKYGLKIDNQGKLVLQKKIPKNLLFLFNSFVYFDALARLTSESNDDIYADQTKNIPIEVDSESAVVSDDDNDSDDDSDSALRKMKSRTLSLSPRSEIKQKTANATSFIDLFNTINLEGHDIDPLLGCAHSLFPIIGKTAILTTRVKKEEKNSLSIVSAAVAIKYELEQWKPSAVFNLREGEDLNLTACISTAEAYRYATLIYLHQLVPEIPSKSSHELLEKVLMLLASIPTSSRTCITHIFPLLIASCELLPGEERTWVLEKWDLLIRKMWIGNIDRSLEIVKECWIRRDIMTKRKKNKEEGEENDGAEKLASKIAGYVASAKGDRRGEEEDLSISGIKSWCHWRTIMKEWGWEVFLG